MNITADAVKQLRERTGAGMMECKRALVETNGDLDAAAELMRKQGLAKADKKASRIAAEGVNKDGVPYREEVPLHFRLVGVRYGSYSRTVKGAIQGPRVSRHVDRPHSAYRLGERRSRPVSSEAPR